MEEDINEIEIPIVRYNSDEDIFFERLNYNYLERFKLLLFIKFYNTNCRYIWNIPPSPNYRYIRNIPPSPNYIRNIPPPPNYYPIIK